VTFVPVLFGTAAYRVLILTGVLTKPGHCYLLLGLGNKVKDGVRIRVRN